MAGDLRYRKGAVWRKRASQLLVDPRHFHRLRMQHDGNLRAGEAGQQFLTFSKRVAEEYRHFFII